MVKLNLLNPVVSNYIDSISLKRLHAILYHDPSNLPFSKMFLTQ